MAYEFHLPDIGEGLHEAEVLSWLVTPGDVISADQPVALVQTDKAAVEIASPVGGKVEKLGAKVGQMVSVGSLLVAIETHVTAETAATSVEGSVYAGRGAHGAAQGVETGRGALGEAQSAYAGGGASGAVHAEQGSHRHKVLAAPAVRKYARDRGVDLTKVTPLDPAGRVTRLDVDRYLASLVDEGEVLGECEDRALIKLEDRGFYKSEGRAVVENEFSGAAATDAVSAAVAEPSNTVVTSAGEERIPIRGLRKRIYENMVRSATTVPQVTSMDDLDATELVRLRDRLLPFAKEAGIKLTYLPFIIKAVTHALNAYPIFNAFVDDKAMEIVYQKQIHIGIATATPEGLIVPVVKHANQKSIFAIAAELEDLARRGRERKLTYKELTGSTFTITSTGANGGWYATPIVNHPEVAILGAHAIKKKAVVRPDDTIVAQQRMGFSLTFDHRVIDGEPAGAFMHKFKELVEHPELLLAL